MIKLLTIVALFAICVAEKKKSEQLRRIINGKPAEEGQFPWQASVFITRDVTKFCGGALISPQFVLTAAHCIRNASIFKVFLGSTKRKSDDPHRIQVDVDSVIVHELNNPETFSNDVGLIKLSAPVECSKHIMPIRLAERNDYLGENEEVTIAGWGVLEEGGEPVDDLQFAQLHTINNNECVTADKHLRQQLVFENVICCDGSQLRQICQGDSGGPLFKYTEDGKATHVGVNSFVKGCGVGYPSAYMRTASFVDWIETNTGISFAQSDFCV